MSNIPNSFNGGTLLILGHAYHQAQVKRFIRSEPLLAKGVYVLEVGGVCVYVGKSDKDLASRVQSHFADEQKLRPFKRSHVLVSVYGSTNPAADESELINDLVPLWNVETRDLYQPGTEILLLRPYLANPDRLPQHWPNPWGDRIPHVRHVGNPGSLQPGYAQRKENQPSVQAGLSNVTITLVG